MLTSLRVFFFYLSAPIVLLGLLLFFILDNKPLIDFSEHHQLSQQDIQRAHQIFNASKLQQGNVHTLSLSAHDLRIALTYILNRQLKSSCAIQLVENQVIFNISLLIPSHQVEKNYLNFRFKLITQGSYPAIRSLTIGKIRFADEFAGLIIENLIKHSFLRRYYILASHHIRQIQIYPEKVDISYQSESLASTEIFPQVINDPALIVYQEKISAIISQHNAKYLLSLSDLMQPLFKLAYQRSDLDTAIAENRSVIFALSSYINQNDLKAFLPINLTTAPTGSYPAFMYQRIDMSKHFIASAALTATGVGVIVQMLGQEKELRDAQSGSGFSFIDLAGDRAGMYFGRYATSSPENARRLQLKMSKIKSYHAFMPDVRDLPENMNQHQFKARFGSIYSQSYQNMLKEIDQRVSQASVYQ